MSAKSVEIDAADAEIEQRPGRVLARRAAAEIVAGDENLGVRVGGLVEHEVGIGRAVVVVAHLREQARAEPGALDRLQVLLGDDHVGVDIVDLERRGDAGQCREFVHREVSAGLIKRVRRSRLAKARRPGKPSRGARWNRSMAKFHEALDDKLIAFIEAQPMFFIASATAEGRVNISPKGLDTFRVLGPRPRAPISTSPAPAPRPPRTRSPAAARPIMFCSFARNPLMLRLFGRPACGAPGSALWREHAGPLRRASRRAADRRRSTSNSVPDRLRLRRAADDSWRRTRTTLTDYCGSPRAKTASPNTSSDKNRVSIDGLPTGLGEP